MPVTLRTPSRRSVLLGGAGLAAAVGLTACSSGSGNGNANIGSGTGSSSATTSGGTTAATDSFPADVSHKYGTTSVPKAPSRIAVDGYTDADPVLALGLVPVGLRQWIPQWKQGVGPWATALLQGKSPKIWADTTVPVEKIAALAPDLIVDVSSGLTQSDYTKLSRLAPTIAPGKGYVDYGTPWDVGSVMIGEALGRKEAMQKLVDAVNQKFTDARTQYPDFAGKTANILAYSGPSAYYAYASEDTRGRFVTSLGMKVPAAVDKAAGSQFYVTVSPEKVDLLEADLLIVMGDGTAKTKAAYQADKIIQGLDAVKKGHALYMDDYDQVMALSASTVLSLPYVIPKLVPQLAATIKA